ncbi:hypothetical protein HPB51_001447 [Rhipicephalus microplus]|uniref:Uncharacterized protein n=1 Tax=Rhipicephalus microplus TaxID=6941 RepID=A0A9J6EF58_RHIMP|nr:hypothetical protein HPB51_001447 [Rhipicephalus microplus]
MDYQLAQSHTLLKYISSSSGTVNCSSFPPFLLVTLISLALCRARALAYCIRVGQLPLDVQAAFGTLAPSVGHGRRVCRILRSETLRQARILRDFLYVQVDRGPGDRSARVKKRHEWTKLIDHAVESRWKQELLLLRRQKRRPQVRSAGQLHVEEGISLPDYVRTTLSLGPKFAVERKNSPAELLSLVRNVSRAAPDSESERCVSEGVDVLYRYAPRGKTIPVRKVVSYLKSNKLCLLPSDKEVAIYCTMCSASNTTTVPWSQGSPFLGDYSGGSEVCGRIAAEKTNVGGGGSTATTPSVKKVQPHVGKIGSKSTMPHLWYLSADFQLFAVAVAVIQTSGRKKRLAAVAFAILSLLCCFMSAWQLYGSNMLPFIVPLHTSYK